MRDLKLNLYKLLSNFLLCKVSDEFLSNKGGRFDSSDLTLIAGLVNGFKIYTNDMSVTFRYKTYVAYLISIVSRYLKLNDEESLHEVIQTLFNQNAIRVVPLNVISKFKELILKKVAYLISIDSFVIYKKEFTELIESEVVVLGENEVYENEELYEDFAVVIREHIYSQNSSLLFEIAKNFDFLRECDDESELLVHFSSFRKRKLNNTSVNASFVKNETKKYKLDNQQTSSNRSARISLDFSDQNNKSIQAEALQISQSATHQENQLNNLPMDTVEPVVNTPCKKLTESPILKNTSILISSNQNQVNENEVLQETTTTKSPKKKFATKLKLKLKRTDVLSGNISSTPISSLSDSGSISSLDNESELCFDDSFERNRIKKKYKKKDTSSELKAIENMSTKELISKKNDATLNSSESDLEKKKENKSKSNNHKKKRDENDVSSVSYDSDDDHKDEKKLKTKSFTRQKWNIQESIYLVAGVIIYGKGNWARILKEFSKQFKDRTSVHLKDKYRNLEKANDMHSLEKQANILIKNLDFTKK